MKRRALLQVLCGATTVGSAALSGCLDDSGSGTTDTGDRRGRGTPTPTQTATETPTRETDRGTPPDEEPPDGSDTPPSTTERSVRTPAESQTWQSDVRGFLDAVRDGAAFGRGRLGDERTEGGAFRLDGETGDVQWTYGSSGPYSSLTDPVVDDALYFGLGDDAIGSGNGELYAVEFDGSERWALEIGSVYDPPVLVDGTLYVASDDAMARAVDASDGSVLWRTDVSDGEEYADPRIRDVGDAVYVASLDLIALEPGDGSTQWRYGLDGETVSRLVAGEGVVYASTYDVVVAVADGEEQWRVDEPGYVSALVSDRLLVSHTGALTAYDPASGDEVWSVTQSENAGGDVGDGVVYVGGERLTAVDAADGTELWSADVGPGRAREVSIVDGDAADGTVVVASDGDARLLGFDADGHETWAAPIVGEIDGVLASERVYVSTSEGVIALEPW